MPTLAWASSSQIGKFIIQCFCEASQFFWKAALALSISTVFAASEMRTIVEWTAWSMYHHFCYQFMHILLLSLIFSPRPLISIHCRAVWNLSADAVVYVCWCHFKVFYPQQNMCVWCSCLTTKLLDKLL